MRKRSFIVPLLYLLLATTGLFAQETDSNWVVVDATVVGTFDFTIDGTDWPQLGPASYDFGTISHSGTNGGVKIGGRVYYTRNGAFTWEIVSAPRRTVDVVLVNPTKTQEPAAGGMQLDQLAIEMTLLSQAPGGTGSSTGLTPVAPNELLLDDALSGFGSAAAAGEINLQIYVDGNDKDGLNTWLLELEATGI